MQVFFDDQIFQKRSVGGISRYICDLAIALARTGKIQVTLFGGWSKNILLQELSKTPNLRIVNIPRKNQLKINSFARIVSRIWRIYLFQVVQKRDREIIYHPTFFQVDLNLHKKAAATVATFYDMIPEIFIDEKQLQHRTEKLRMAEVADRIIAISNSTRKDLSRFYPFVKDKVEVVYLGSSLGLLQNDRGVSIKYAKNKYFLMVGNRNSYKNGLVCFRAFALIAREFPEICLVVCGGKRQPSKDERRLIDDHNLGNRIHFLSADDGMLTTLFRGAVGLVYPSLYEGFGLPVLEALQNACPVVTTPSSSIPEVAGNAAFYIDPHDPQTIANAMKTLLENPKRRQGYIEDGYRQAQKFSLEIAAQETINVYRKAVEFKNFT